LERRIVIQTKGLSKQFKMGGHQVNALSAVDIDIYTGEIVSIVGPSGSGKSTLLTLLGGLDQPSSGSVQLDGVEISKMNENQLTEIRNEKIGFIFQFFNLVPTLTALENVALPIQFARKPQFPPTQRAKELLALFGLKDRMHHVPSQLSGGQQQRVAIARALAIRPQVLILDEPFGALDAITKEELQEELLKIWQEHQLTVLMITHDIDEALFLCDRLVMMTNGPSAKIGEVLKMPFARPRVRSQITEDPRYYELRNEALDFLYNRFAHSEDPNEDAPEQPRTENLVGKIVTTIGGIALLAFVGFSLIQMFTSKTPNTTNPATIEDPR